MKVINLTGNEVLDGLHASPVDGKWGDYYRKFAKYDKDNILALYYKDLDLDTNRVVDLLDKISILKKCKDMEYTWEHYTMCQLFSLINRLERIYTLIDKSTDLQSPIITGIALYENYPVGTLLPKQTLNYMAYSDILTSNLDLTMEEKTKILGKTKYLLGCLMNSDVYPNGIYRGNIMVNPNDYNDVRLDGLDGPCVTRVESKDYVRTLKKRGWDLVEDTWSNFEKIR